MRHNFLTEKALDGENPSIVRRWAGHKTYAMTDYYFGIAEDKLAATQPRQSTLSGIHLPSLNDRKKRSSRPASDLAAPRNEVREKRGPGRPRKSLPDA